MKERERERLNVREREGRMEKDIRSYDKELKQRRERAEKDR